MMSDKFDSGECEFMKLFHNMKLSAKILSGFLIVLILLGFVGVSGWNSLNRLNDAYNKLYENNVKDFIYISNVLEGFERQRINSRNILLSRNPSEMTSYLQKVDEIDNFYKSSLQEFGSIIKEKDVQTEYQKLNSLS